MDVVQGFKNKVERNPAAFGVEDPALRARVVARLASELERLLQQPEYAIEYTRSDGSKHKLTLAQLVERKKSFEMAYNPNDCVEIRWAAAEDSAEMSSCKRHAPAEQRDRNGTVVVQGGRGQYAGGVQSGYNNFLRMDQYGTRNSVGTAQIGGNNFAVTGQDGLNLRADTLQTGYGNVSGIAQIGTSNKAVADQDGYNNTSGIIQVGNGQDVTVRQRGEGNISVVVQSGYD